MPREPREVLELDFGALVPSIADQLAAKGMKAARNDLKHWQADANAITRLSIRGLISDSAARAARQKLTRKIAAGVKRASLGEGE